VPERLAFVLRVCKGFEFILLRDEFFSASPAWLVPLDDEKVGVMKTFFTNSAYQGPYGAWALAHFLRRPVVVFFPELALDAAVYNYVCEPLCQLDTKIPIVLLSLKTILSKNKTSAATLRKPGEFFEINHYEAGGFSDKENYGRLPKVCNILLQDELVRKIQQEKVCLCVLFLFFKVK
jgi:hypothetical protein